MKKMIVTDLDGTLLNSNGYISDTDRSTLEKLGSEGYCRVIATGRSPFSISRTFTKEDIPIDYLVFSSGAGITEWKTGKLILAYNLSAKQLKRAYNHMCLLGLDFFILDAVPNNHKCRYVRSTYHNSDFERRVSLYQDYAEDITGKPFEPSESCQLIAILDGYDAVSIYEEVKAYFHDLAVIRSTSPLDHTSLWLEIYSPEVSKANGIKHLAELLDIKKKDIMAVGNDYNDIDMLRWAGRGYAVHNAPDVMKDEFIPVASHKDSGFTEAVNRWLKQ
jgi:Cof subfamily protein (haloacid dehalogenase superfamily)